MIRSSFPLLALAATLAACASRPAVVVEAPPPPPVAVAPPAMPEGGVPGMAIPARLADGDYATPSRPGGARLSADAAVWHLRAALNVAALACRDEATVTAYNALLARHRVQLSQVEARYAAEWKATGAADWRDAYDHAMTRVYNFYGQAFARPGFCPAARTALAELAALPDSALTVAAADRLAAMDRPFTTFFAAYEAWRGGQAPVRMAALAPVPAAPPRPIIALAAPGSVPAATVQHPMAAPIAPATVSPPVQVPSPVAAAPVEPPAAKPRLVLDPSVFQLP